MNKLALVVAILVILLLMTNVWVHVQQGALEQQVQELKAEVASIQRFINLRSRELSR
jgi:hypothetical protein